MRIEVFIKRDDGTVLTFHVFNAAQSGLEFIAPLGGAFLDETKSFYLTGYLLVTKIMPKKTTAGHKS